MEQNTIETRLVQGFMDSGKTTFIQDCILNDYFHKYGSTLILCFEQGESEYDIAALRERRTEVAFFGDEEEENVNVINTDINNNTNTNKNTTIKNKNKSEYMEEEQRIEKERIQKEEERKHLAESE